jgi:pimeloyl-ACP methyl ester carboxylesterase
MNPQGMTMATPLVRKRCFVQMTGYEPVGAEHYHRRFIREMARFLKAWNLQGTVSPATVSADGHVVSFNVDTSGPNWQVQTNFHYLRWDDIVSADMGESDFRRFPLGIAAMLEFVLTGTAGRYFAIAPRYGGFFCYPLVFILGMIWLGISMTRFSVIHLGLPYPLLLAPLVLCAVLVVLRQTFGRMVFIRYALDDWYFARDMVHRVRPELEKRLDRFARELVRLARETDADEIVVDGHSLGAPISIAVVDRALQLDPQLGRGDKQLHVVSTGSSLLKVALHPGAGWLREAVGRVANSPAVYWVEYQALVDVINVYKVDPVAALGMPATGKPIVRIIRIRHMVEEHTYKRFHLNFLRIHRQAVMGNERRYFYDYYMLCCGPVRLRDRVDNQDQMVAAFAADGTLVIDDPGAQTAAMNAAAG